MSEHEQAQKELCDVIRKCMDSSRSLTFSCGEGGKGPETILDISVWAKINESRIAPFNYDHLLASVKGEFETEPTETSAVINGHFKKYRCRIAIKAELPTDPQ